MRAAGGTARSLRAYLAGARPSPNGPAERREQLVARAAERFLDPPRPRLAEARAFFAPARGAGDEALLGRWEGAAGAGLIPVEWVDSSPLIFLSRRGAMRRPAPFTVGAAVAIAADVEGFERANELARIFALLSSTWKRAAPSDDPWFGAAEWTRLKGSGGVRTDVGWMERRSSFPICPLGTPWDMKRALRWTGAIAPLPVRWSRIRVSRYVEHPDLLPVAFADVLERAVVFDEAVARGVGPYALEPDEPNMADVALELLGLGYCWEGQWLESDPGQWVCGFRPDDFEERP